MTSAANVKGYRRPEIGEASGSNPRVQALRRGWTDGPSTSSTARKSAPSASQSLQSAGRVDHVRPDLSLLPLEGTSSEGDSGGEEDDDQQEQEEAHSAPFSILLPTMDIEFDNETVSEFCFDGHASEDRGMGSWNNSSTSLASRWGVTLQRTSTMESIRTRVNQTSLGRTFTSGSSWSVALRYAPKFEYTLKEWCQTIQDSASLRTAEIIKVDRYRQRTGPRHRFLVFQLRRNGKTRDIFLRLDRLVDTGFNLFKLISTSSVTPANDRAFLTADEGRAVRGNTPANVKIVPEARLEFVDPSIRPPTLADLQHILDAIILQMTKYRLTKENCWLFCVVCLEGLLQQFKGTFTSGELEHAGLGVILRAAGDLRVSIYARIPKPEITPELEPVPEPEPEIVPSLLHTISTQSRVLSIAVSPDGNHIVSGHQDSSIRLWDAQTGAADGEPLEGHTDRVRSVAFSPNGRWIVSGSDDKSIRVWDMETRTAVGEPLRGHSKFVISVAFSPDGDRIVSGSWDDTIRLWDRATGDAIGEPLQGHSGGVYSVTFSPDGRMIASGSNDKTIRLWEATTGKPIREPLVGHTNWVQSVAFSPNGQHIASGSFDKTIRIWDTATGVQIGEPIKGHTHYVMSVVYSPDGRYIASGSNDRTILFWDAMTGAAIGAPLNANRDDGVDSVCFYPDGRRIASCGGWWLSDNTIRIWPI